MFGGLFLGTRKQKQAKKKYDNAARTLATTRPGVKERLDARTRRELGVARATPGSTYRASRQGGARPTGPRSDSQRIVRAFGNAGDKARIASSGSIGGALAQARRAHSVTQRKRLKKPAPRRTYRPKTYT